MDGFRIEKARPEHLADILAIMNAGAVGARVGQESEDPEDYRAAFDAILSAAETDIYVVLGGADGSQVLATYQIIFEKGLAFRGRGRACLESVHTRADMRGRGIGKAMVQHAEALARARGVALVQLTSNRIRLDAHRFYLREGYDQSHLGFKKML
ncbi:N-acetyltransferase family protein [Pannonibacter phragmitetus]|uniref:GNAT family N-acetyltransferase n=1 Tax=Pannonibacter phragmitetus TaxID=121719 RepID=UPI003D2F4028